MNITVNKDGKDYEFKYTKERTGISKGTQKDLVFHKWTNEELKDAEGANLAIFWGEYDGSSSSTPEANVDRATILIKKQLGIVDEVVIEPAIEEFTEIEEPKEEGFFAKLKNKLTNN